MNGTTPMLRELTIRCAVKSITLAKPSSSRPGTPATPQRGSTLQRVLGDEATEVLASMLLSTRRDVVAYHEVSRGGLNTVAVEPRAVFTAALLANAAAMIVAHVHQRQSVAQSGRRRAHASPRGGRDPPGRGRARSHHRGHGRYASFKASACSGDTRGRRYGCRAHRDGSRRCDHAPPPPRSPPQAACGRHVVQASGSRRRRHG